MLTTNDYTHNKNVSQIIFDDKKYIYWLTSLLLLHCYK